MLNKRAVSLVLLLSLPVAAFADDAVFKKTLYAPEQSKKEVAVELVIGDRDVAIHSKERKHNPVDITLPYASIDKISWEYTQHHRIAEGASVMVFSLGVGAILMATKEKSYWLYLDHSDAGAKVTTVLHLDKSEYKAALDALQARSGKTVEVLDPKVPNTPNGRKTQ